MIQKTNIKRFYIKLVIFLIILILSAFPSYADQSNVYIEPSISIAREIVTIDSGKYIYYDLILNRKTKVNAEFKIVGGTGYNVKVWLLDKDNFQRYAAGQQFFYLKGFSGEIYDVGKYTFEIPEDGAYYLIIDNKQALFGFTRVKVSVYGILPEVNSGANSIEQQKAIENLKTLKKAMKDFYQLTKKFFIFQDFRIEVRYCGFANAFSSPNITLCKELIENLVDQGIEKAVVFILFHELGHTLLRLWEYPLWDNEDVADEFATIFMLLSNREDAALDAAQWFASKTSIIGAVEKIWVDDKHTLSPQRARNIIN